ncbi:hypothetical protein M378DRAFT_820079 [Amanita muscaria Koide BX008]|uniref:Uncharacterized protein n=1 Tax=Amanita muscaria (strain Koide BX008) TaxID=946122 RepID=A0A0C2SF93_AMAMK|nr:hypothetical protein M378DRAFT_820079 [Amanita muscaria Koide BX008]
MSFGVVGDTVFTHHRLIAVPTNKSTNLDLFANASIEDDSTFPFLYVNCHISLPPV